MVLSRRIRKANRLRSTQRLWKIGEKPVVLAHRGGGNEAPENSLVAFSHMEDLGFKYIETDSHATKDGVVILFHDPILNRTTDGWGRISHHTWAQIQQIKDDSGNHPLRLSEVLENFPNIILNIDAKELSVVRPLARVIKQHSAINQVSLSSFSETRLKMLRRLLPGVVTSIGKGGILLLVISSRLPWHFGKLLAKSVPSARSGAQAVQVPKDFFGIEIVTPKFIELCHQREQAVHVWTINEEDEMRELLQLGVDGIITDEPSLARRIIDEYYS